MVYRPHLSDSGSADISLSSSSLELTVALGRNPTNNHFAIKATGCSVNIGHLSVDFHGGARYCNYTLNARVFHKSIFNSWLYNLFNDQIAGSLKDSLSKSLCTTAVKYIDTSGNAAVESIPSWSNLCNKSLNTPYSCGQNRQHFRNKL